MNKQYCEKYDAYYDADTDTWLEKKCSDPDCEYCVPRLDKPSQCKGHYHGDPR